MINPLWIMFALVFGGLGIWLIALDALMAGWLMCCRCTRMVVRSKQHRSTVYRR